MVSYYFNNNFNEIIRLRNQMYYNHEINRNDLLKLKQLISEYGINEDKRHFRIVSSEYGSQKAVEGWLSFEYPDVTLYEDLKECRNEPNILDQLYSELTSKPIIENDNPVKAIKELKDTREVVGTSIPQKIVMLGIPAGLIALISYLANL